MKCKICKKQISAEEQKLAWGEHICTECWEKRADNESGEEIGGHF